MSQKQGSKTQQFPSRLYRKYKSQTKTNLLFNKLNNDTGYPQEIFGQGKSISFLKKQEAQKNYIQMNTKNLKNFFSDRLPPKPEQPLKLNFTIEPGRMFQMKRRQLQLKLQTKITLDNTFDSQNNQNIFQPKKISEVFSMRDKNLEFRNKFLEAEEKYPKRVYEENNYMKGTQSFVKKYSKISKKQAYINTFGPEESLTTRRASTFRPYNTIQIPRARTSSLNSQRKKYYNMKTIDEQKLNRKKFSLALEKLDHHRQSLDPDDKAKKKSYVVRVDQSSELEKQNQKKMTKYISEISNTLKNKVVKEGRDRIDSLHDISKIDQKFFKQMNAHKSKRLQIREKMVIKNSNISSANNSQIVNSNTEDQMVRTLQQRFNLQEKSLIEDNFSISDSSLDVQKSHDEIEVPIVVQQSKQQKIALRFQSLGHSLVQTLRKAKMYEISDKQDIYNAFWNKKEPYQLQGSYALFTSIKKGQVEAFQQFIKVKKELLYERDHKDRSPLIYACVCNQTQIISLILERPINLEDKSASGKTALYYALKHENIQIIQRLLKKGMNPWSKPRCSYKQILKGKNNEQIKNLMKNSRIIWIAIQMKLTWNQQFQIWLKNKDKISTHSLIKFE